MEDIDDTLTGPEDGILEQDDPAVAGTARVIDDALLCQIVEGAILAAAQPLTIARLLELFDEATAPSKDAIQQALEEIQTQCEGRGFELKEVASGWRFQVRDNLAGWVNRLWDEKPQKYSRALLETLSLIAYRQPITRGDIEEIRGVAVSSHIMKTLLERDWVKVIGHRDVPGRPSLYATTRQFLDYFNLKSLEDLPSLSEIRDLDEINASLELNVTTDNTESTADNSQDAEDADETRKENVITADLQQGVAETLAQEEFVDGEEAYEVIEKAALPESPLLSDSDSTTDTENQLPEDHDRNA